MLGIFFLDLCGIGEHDRQQIGCGRTGVDWSSEPSSHKFWQEAAMINMAMGVNDIFSSQAGFGQ